MYYHQPTVATYPTYPFHHQQPFHQLPRPHYQSYMYPNSYPNYDENPIMSSSNMNSSTTKRSRREYENDGGDDDDEEMQDQDVIKQEAKRVRTEGTQIHESSNNVGNGGDGWMMNHGVNSNNNNARNSLFESVSQNSNTSNNNNLLNSFQIQQHEYQRKRQYRYQQQQAQEMQQLQHELSNQQQELRSSRSDVVYKNINTILHDLHVQKRHRKKSKPTSNIV